MDIQLEEDLYYFRKIGDLIYADWVFGRNQDTEHLTPSKVKFGFEAIKRLISKQ